MQPGSTAKAGAVPVAAAGAKAQAAPAGGNKAWICHLCQRKFQTEEMLKKHETLSNLHKQNLEKKRKKEEAERAALAAGLAGGETKEGDAA